MVTVLGTREHTVGLEMLLCFSNFFCHGSFPLSAQLMRLVFSWITLCKTMTRDWDSQEKNKGLILRKHNDELTDSPPLWHHR